MRVCISLSLSLSLTRARSLSLASLSHTHTQLTLINRHTSGEISDSHPRQLHATNLTDQDDGKDHHEQEERERRIGPHNVWSHGALMMKRGGGT